MNKRLRKKKYLGEFKELGFELEFNINYNDDMLKCHIINKLIDIAEDNNLSLGGGSKGNNFYFFIMSAKRYSSPTEYHMNLFRDYLIKINATNISLGELRDANYGWKF